METFTVFIAHKVEECVKRELLDGQSLFQWGKNDQGRLSLGETLRGFGFMLRPQEGISIFVLF